MPRDPSHTLQPERKLNWLCNGRRKYVTERGSLLENKTALPSMPL